MKNVVSLLVLAATVICHLPVHGMEGYGFDYDDAVSAFDYNPQAVTTVRGRIIKIDFHEKSTGMGNAVILTLQAGEKKVLVVLAPQWFIDNQKFELKENQYVTVLGSQIEYNKTPLILAAEVTYNDKVLTLRDKTTGKPQWSEWRKGEGVFYKNYKI